MPGRVVRSQIAMVTLAAKRDSLDEEEISLFKSAPPPTPPQLLYFNFLSPPPPPPTGIA